MAGRLAPSNPVVMHDQPATHLFTESGPLCGVAPPYHWSLAESDVSCPSCRVILQIRGLRQRQDARPLVVTRERAEPAAEHTAG